MGEDGGMGGDGSMGGDGGMGRDGSIGGDRGCVNGAGSDEYSASLDDEVGLPSAMAL
jgi:hypothetical protein